MKITVHGIPEYFVFVISNAGALFLFKFLTICSYQRWIKTDFDITLKLFRLGTVPNNFSFSRINTDKTLLG